MCDIGVEAGENPQISLVDDVCRGTESLIRRAVLLGSAYINCGGAFLVLGECIYGAVLEYQDKLRPWGWSAMDVHQ